MTNEELFIIIDEIVEKHFMTYYGYIQKVKISDYDTLMHVLISHWPQELRNELVDALEAKLNLPKETNDQR